jgi:outer membrane receptor protein involved in Fe transport
MLDCRVRASRLLLASLLFAGTAAAQSVRVEGVIRDASGAAVAGATVTLKSGPASASRATNAAGVFTVENFPQPRGTIIVRASGFSDAQRAWDAGTAASVHLEFALEVASVREQVVVTATRMPARLGDTATSSVELSSDDLDATPALSIDDKLKQIPGFSLFRRTGSRWANPTSQGVSLSGLGASGASRALVLNDGVPLNDPFGGWVQWSSIPDAALSRVEVVRRGASSLYGGDALGGAIQVFEREPQDQPSLALDASYGNQNTPDLSLWTGGRSGAWDAALSADLYHTDGYVLVPPADRGAVDTPANSEDAAVSLTIGRRLGDRTRIFGRGSFFTESRDNGTPLQTNDTQIATGVAGLDTGIGASGTLSVRLYGDAQSYDQSFSSIAANRATESLTDLQHVPAQRLGGTAWWAQPVGRHQTIGAGVELNEVIGASDERIFSSGKETATQDAGGRQRTFAVFGEDVVRLGSRWTVTGSLRFDQWRNFDAQSVRTPLTTSAPPTVTPFPDRTETAVSPRLSVLYAVNKNFALSASAYHSFRAPTLNELYRPFRMGNILTLANANLNAERLTGGEAGASASTSGGKLTLRGNFFWNDITDPIENVTISTTPSLITRQRQNLGLTRSVGFELEGVARISRTVEVSGGYQFVDPTVLQFSANPALVGLKIPQVPQNQFTVQARYWKPSGFLLSVQGRFTGNQFDDDQNMFPLGKYFVVDALAGRSLGHGMMLYAAFENLLNQQYFVAMTPTPNIGPRFLIRGGLRYNLPERK